MLCRLPCHVLPCSADALFRLARQCHAIAWLLALPIA
jgi:hypothetical protein